MSCHFGLFRRFIRAERGATAVEFALVAPILILLMMGIIEFSLIQFSQGMLEVSTFNASRLGKTGYVPAGKTRQQAILDMINDKTAGLLDNTKLTMTSKVYRDFATVDQPEPFTDRNGNSRYDAGETYTDTNGNGRWDADMGAAGLGAAGDIVVYTVSYPWSFFTPMISTFFPGGLTLSVRAVVKNEPYDA